MFARMCVRTAMSAAVLQLACFPAVSAAFTCADLDGAYVASQENPGVYLGFFGSPFAADSIENQFGKYGSPYQATSVHNEFGPYGSTTGPYSANNSLSVAPPITYKYQAPLFYLTTNTLRTPGLTIAGIDASCGTSFTAMEPALNAPASELTIVPGLSGNWYDPTPGQDGHGVQLEILPNNQILAIWFVFTPDGSGQTWLFSLGTYDPSSNTVTMPAYITTGRKFPPAYKSSDGHVTQWGTLTFAFTDCDSGVASWTSTAAGYQPSGSFPIARITKIAGTTCP